MQAFKAKSSSSLLKHRIKIVILFFAAISSFSSAVWSNDSLNDKQWLEDISVYLEQLEQNHMNLFHTVPKAQLSAMVDNLQSHLPELSDNEILVKLMELTRKIGDGHTSFPLWGPKLNKFPIKLTAIDQKLFVSAVTNEYESLFRSELLAINGKPINDVVSALSMIVPFSENSYSTSVRVAQYLPIAEVLNGAGFIGSQLEAAFTFKVNGQSFVKKLRARKTHQFQKSELLAEDNFKEKVALVNPGLWFSSSEDRRSIYVSFKRYTDLQSMDEFASRLLAFINKNTSKSLIIDLRDNYGGDFFVGLKLAQYLVRADSLNWQSGIFVLINNVTFSAAMSNAAQFKRILNAQLVGEPTGAMPRGYQDMGEFSLPHSKRVVTYSKRFYDFMGNNKDAIYPDRVIKRTVEDFLTDSDRQLEWTLQQVGWD